MYNLEHQSLFLYYFSVIVKYMSNAIA